MTLADLLHFYLGDGETIRRMSADPWTLGVGAPLVFSAGLARHYDTHDLMRQGWRLLVPFAASIFAAVLLLGVIMLVTGAGGDVVSLGRGILGLFWLTAPLAWLYGLPFERLFPAPQAARARRGTLGLVSVLRVTSMAVCVGALLDSAWWVSLSMVACFAVPMAILAVAAALFFLRGPESIRVGRLGPGASGVAVPAQQVVDFMGVVPEAFPDHERVSGRDLPMLETTDNTAAGVGLACLSVVLLGVSSWVLAKMLPGQHVKPLAPPLADGASPSPAVWGAAALAVLFWVPWLIFRQPAHRRRSLFVDRLQYGPLEEVVGDLAKRWPAEFPPFWNPAMALAQPDFAPRMLEATRIAAKLPAGAWVRTCFLEQIKRMIPMWLDSVELWLFREDRMPADQLQELARLHDLLRQLPECQDLLQPYQEYLAELTAYTRERDPARCEILQDLLALALRRGAQR